MKLIVGSDKAGFALKEAVKAHLVAAGHDVADLGTSDLDHVSPYFEVGAVVARAMQCGEAERAFLFCGTGMGVSVIANRHKGITASVCESETTARLCRVINNANILCMGGWLITELLAKRMADIFLSTEFTEGMPERAEWLCKAYSTVQALDQDGSFNG